MKRVKSVSMDRNKTDLNVLEDYRVCINYYDDSTSTRIFSKIERLELCGGDNKFKNKIISDIILPTRDKMQEVTNIEFEECIFMNALDLNFFVLNAKVRFEKCIFLKDFSIFGYFKKVVSFTESTFIDSKVSFQECEFEHFVFNLVTLNTCNVDFQETKFYGNNIYFDNIDLNKSNLYFTNTFFPKNADLLDLLGVNSDKESKIFFIMVDFKFGEIRVFDSNISRLEFIDCTFECNRFDFNFSCKTLIMQDCKNFRILTLYNLKDIENLNIYNFVNTGKVLINQDPDYFIDAINTKKEIIYKGGGVYETPSYEECRNQLFLLQSFYDLSQDHCIENIKNSIEVLDKMEKLKNEPDKGMRIFLSYSWADDELANSIDEIFMHNGITLIRDRRELRYKSSIKEFMKQIRREDFALIIISDNYLKSASCMYEVGEFIKDESYKERILPIVKNDAKIFKAIDRNQYLLYWQEQYNKLKKESKDLDELNRVDTIKELLRYERIQRDLPDFLSDISDMNLITCENSISDFDFDKIKVLLFGDL